MVTAHKARVFEVRSSKGRSWFRQWNNQCWGPVLFWYGSGSPDPYLWLLDPDPAQSPDPTSFFIYFKDVPKNIFFIYFLITCPQAQHLHSKKFCKNFVLKLHFAGIISVRSTPLWEKGRIRIRTSDCSEQCPVNRCSSFQWKIFCVHKYWVSISRVGKNPGFLKKPSPVSFFWFFFFFLGFFEFECFCPDERVF